MEENSRITSETSIIRSYLIQGEVIPELDIETIED